MQSSFNHLLPFFGYPARMSLLSRISPGLSNFHRKFHRLWTCLPSNYSQKCSQPIKLYNSLISNIRHGARYSSNDCFIEINSEASVAVNTHLLWKLESDQIVRHAPEFFAQVLAPIMWSEEITSNDAVCAGEPRNAPEDAWALERGID